MSKTDRRTTFRVSMYGVYCSFLIFLFLGLTSCQSRSESSEQGDQNVKEESIVPSSETAETEYVCPMRCAGSGQDDPGTCPVCNMLLVRSVEVEDFDPENSEYTQGSVYNLEGTWLTQNGDPIQLADLSDDFQLVCMIFTACPGACPNLIGDMLSIDTALELETKEKLKYLLVTIDPDNDSPERLSRFANTHNLNTDRWTLLQGEKDNIRQLSNLLGVEYKQYDNGSFGHTNYLILLNRKGEIIYRLHGIHVSNEDMLGFMHKYI